MPNKLKINWKKFLIEISAILVIVTLPATLGFFDWLLKQPIGEREQYNEESALYRQVLEFDYQNGNHSELKDKLQEATSRMRDPVTYFFNLLAEATYYCEVEEYQICYDALEKAQNFCPSKSYCQLAADLRTAASNKLGADRKD